jgi:pre-mRNA splicing factor component
MRTPMAGGALASSGGTMSKQQSIMREASNLRRLERGQTPLLGGDNPMLFGQDDDDDEMGDIDSRKPAATPHADRNSAGGQTPSGASVFSRRDQLGLNRPMSEMRGGMDDSASVGASTFATSAANMSIRDLAREERRAAKRARKQLEEALAALPGPQFEYELATPADMDFGGEDDDDDGKPGVETVEEEDAADIEAAKQKRLQQEGEKAYEARSSVVKRKDLPRPVGSIPEALISVASDDLERLIEQERWTLLRHDAYAFPVEPPVEHEEPSSSTGKKSKKKKKSGGDEVATTVLPREMPLDCIPEAALNAAKSLIQAELEGLL